MIWVLMNVNNPDISLFVNNPLPNTGRIVVVGSPETGWTLTDWNGTSIAQWRLPVAAVAALSYDGVEKSNTMAPLVFPSSSTALLRHAGFSGN